MKYIIVQAKVSPTFPRRTWAGVHQCKRRLPPHMDRLASGGELGLATLPADVAVGGSDVMALALLGYDPRKIHAGPAPFEAVGQGIAVGEHDVVFRCSMVTLAQGRRVQGPRRM